jgi:hypothetical protein
MLEHLDGAPSWTKSKSFTQLKPVLTFVVEILVATAVLGIVGLAAVAISLAVHWLEAIKIDGLIVSTLSALEYAVLACDAILYILFVGKSTVKTARELLWEL